MNAAEWLLIVANASAASLLLNSGIAKAVSPAALRRALTEMGPAFESVAAPAVLRGFAAVEIVVAITILVEPARMAGAAAASLLGVGFAAFGVLGLVRGGGSPCGCFGASGQQPLGWPNVALGAMLAAAYPVNAGSGGVPESAADHTTGAVLLASVGSLLLCVYTNRRLVRRHLAIGRRASGARSSVGMEAR